MKMKQDSEYRLIRRAYLNLAVSSILVLLATNICGFVDNIMISRFLGTKELAAVGLFSPVTTVIGFSYVIILGASVLCANFIGAGKREEVNVLFYSAFMVLTIAGLLLTLGCYIFRGPLATLLNAKGEIHELLCDYIVGYIPGVIPQALCAFLMSLVSYNNDIRRSYDSTAVMIVVNALGNWALAGPMGIAGIGLASTISSLAAFLVLLPRFLNKDKALHLEKKHIDLGLIGKAASRGLPSLMFTLGLIVKNYLMNYTLNTYSGNDGVAVMNVLGSVCAITGALPGGFCNAYMSLAGLYYGEEDRSSLKKLYLAVLETGLTSSIILILAIMAASPLLSSLFFPKGTEIWNMGRRMFLLGFIFIPPNLVMNLHLKSYQVQGKMGLVNFMSTAETALVGIWTFLTVPTLGVDAAWTANIWIDIACLAIIAVSVFLWRGRIDFSISALQKLPDDFGAAPDEVREYSVRSIEETVTVSEAVTNFLKERNTPVREAFIAGLCVEEMAGNVLEHGFTKGRPNGTYSADVRIVCRDEITIRIRDNCPEFDPRKRMDQFEPERAEKNIGIRMTAGLAKRIDYYNTAGVNTVLIKL